MRLKQTGALLLASVMMVGTIGMMNPTQVHAVTPTAPTNQYTLTVPAETTLAYDGSAVALTNGLKVSGGDLEDGKKVTVTAASANEWKLNGSKTETTTTIAYGLYDTADATDTTTSWDFSKEDAADDGKTVEIYSMIVANDYKSATADDYSDTITFTAAVVDAGPAKASVTFTCGNSSLIRNNNAPESATVELVAKDGQTWGEIAANNDDITTTDSGQVKVSVTCTDGSKKPFFAYIKDGAAVKTGTVYHSSDSYVFK